jgi:histidinol dehydrogenase
VDDFVKKTSMIYVSKQGINEYGEKAARFAEIEGLTAHAAAVRKRI